MMHLLLLGKISGVRFLWSGKRTDEFVNAGMANSGLPSVALQWGFADPTEPGFAASSGRNNILVIQQRGCAKQVRNSVVGLDAIKVIDNAIWPIPMNVKPRGPMGLNRLIVYAEDSVAARVNKPGRLTLNGATTFAMRSPSKLAGGWVVMQKIAKALCGKILISHDDSLIVRLVRSLDRVTALSGLRYFKPSMQPFVRRSLPPEYRNADSQSH